MTDKMIGIEQLQLPCEWVEKLKNLNIHYAQGLAALVHSKKSLLSLLHDHLGLISEEDKQALALSVNAFSSQPTDSAFRAQAIACGLVEEPGVAENKILSEDLAQIEIPPSFDLLEETVTPVKHQGVRGTCVAQSSAKAEEINGYSNHGLTHSLSAQFIYHQCKKNDGIPDQQGTYLSTALEVLATDGVCLEAELPYDPLHSGTEAGQPPTQIAVKSAKKRKSVGMCYAPIGKDMVVCIKAMVCGAYTGKPKAVCFGASLYESFFNAYTEETGTVFLPLPGEDRVANHAMVVVGYSDDNDSGEGEFIVFNSWGERFGDKGKMYIPYAYFESHVHVAGAALHSEDKPISHPGSSERKEIAAVQNRRDLRIGTGRQGQTFQLDTVSGCNQNWCVVGASGEGKTTFIKNLVLQLLRVQPTQTTHIIEPHDDYADLVCSPACQELDIGRLGLPFRWLDNPRHIPADLFINNMLAEIKSIVPVIGNVQLGRLKSILEAGHNAVWGNARLREEFELVKDENLKAQLSPIMLLLRESDGADSCFENPGNIFIHNLRSFQNPVTRGAYGALFLSKLMDSRQVGKNAGHVNVVFEEAQLLAKSKATLERYYQEARKFNLSAMFITQILTNVPASVSRNAAQKVLFRTAAEDWGITDQDFLPGMYEALFIQGSTKEVIKLSPPQNYAVRNQGNVSPQVAVHAHSFNEFPQKPTRGSFKYRAVGNISESEVKNEFSQKNLQKYASEWLILVLILLWIYRA